ncbi:hypothetical protein METHPM2_280054 [Pseudomonas sp. PM2]
MREHLRMAACYWHTFVWPGADIQLPHLECIPLWELACLR